MYIRTFLYLKGSDSEIRNMIKVLNEIDIENVHHLQKSNKYNKYFTGVVGCCRYSTENHEYLNNKGYTNLIWLNKRNIEHLDIYKFYKIFV